MLGIESTIKAAFIYSLNKYLVRTYSGLGTVFGTKDVMVSKMKMAPDLLELLV